MMANKTGSAAVAERPADSVWLSTLPTPRIAPVSGSARPSAEMLRAVRPAVGELAGLPGAVTDLAVERVTAIAQRVDHRVLVVRAPPPGHETMRLAFPALVFQERRCGVDQAALHINNGAVLIKDEDIYFPGEN